MSDVLQTRIGDLERENSELRQRLSALSDAVPYRDADGQITAVLAITRDITARNQAVQALRESQERFATIFHSSPVGICVTKLNDGTFLDANDAFLRITGHSRLEVIGRSSLDPILNYYVSSEDRPRLVAALREKGTLANYELPFRRKDGSVRLSLRWLERIQVAGQDCILTILHDITEERQAAEKLAVIERKFRALVENSYDGISVFNPDATIQYVSPGVQRILGYPAAELMGRICFELVHAEDLERVQRTFGEILQRPDQSVSVTFRGHHRDGTFRWIEGTATNLLADSALHGIIANFRDITERKQVEAALSEKERLLSESQRIAQLGSWSWEIATGLVLWSEESYRIYGLTPSSSKPTVENFLSLIHPEDLPAMQEWIRACLALEQPGELEFCIVRPDGIVRTINGRGDMVFDSNHVPIRIIGTVHDVSERRQAEADLRENEKRLRLTTVGSNTGLWDWDLRTNEVHFSTIWKRQIGYEDHEISNAFDEWQSRVHPDDLERALATVAASLANPCPHYESEFRLRHKDGSYRWILAKGSLQRDLQGQPIRMLGSHIDVTERRQMEDALREGHQRLEALSRQLIATQEAERRHLARELHDEIGQMLTGIKLNLTALSLGTVEPAEAAGLSSTLAIVDGLITQVRTLSLDLRPSMLDDIGVVAALNWLLDRHARSAGFTAQLVLEDSFPGASKDIETACFRIAQEILTNVVRHAHARQVRVELVQRESELELRIQDDGRGFEVVEVRERARLGASVGVLGMEERAQLVGGRLEIVSAPGCGTIVRAILPT
jgi:PAS domain S-box-containing protein